MNPIIISTLTQVLVGVLKKHGVLLMAHGLAGVFVVPSPSGRDLTKCLVVQADDDRVRIMLNLAGVEVDIERSYDDLNYDFQWAVDWLIQHLKVGDAA